MSPTQEERVRRMVRRVVQRTLGRQASLSAVRGRPLVTETDLMQVAAGEQYVAAPGALITPLARQAAMDRRIRLVESAGRFNPGPETGGASPSAGPASGERSVAIGADHAGYALKERIKSWLAELGYSVVDCGTESSGSVDYPDYALAVAEHVARGAAWRGIMVDGAGIGSCMAANKVPGVRAALCYDLASAVNSREHNDANLLTLGAGMIGENLARQIVVTWLAARFGGDRHARRVDKIRQIEQRFCRAK